MMFSHLKIFLKSSSQHVQTPAIRSQEKQIPS